MTLRGPIATTPTSKVALVMGLHARGGSSPSNQAGRQRFCVDAGHQRCAVREILVKHVCHEDSRYPVLDAGPAVTRRQVAPFRQERVGSCFRRIIRSTELGARHEIDPREARVASGVDLLGNGK